MVKKLFIFGLGYVGFPTALQALKRDFEVFGTTRRGKLNQEILQIYPTVNVSSISRYSFEQESSIKDILTQNITHVLITIAPVKGRDLVWEKYGDFLKHMPSLQWIGYLSTTGVYGDYQGQWVDEQSPCHPSQERTQIRLRIEREWLYAFKNMHIMRLSGIYGPGRNVFKSLKNGTVKRIDKLNHVFSLIHVEDIVQTLLASMARPEIQDIYNVADDFPTSSASVIEYACQLLNMPFPPLISLEAANLSEMGKGFYQEYRRVSNQKIKEKLKIILKYSDYKKGLENLYETENYTLHVVNN